MKLRTDYQTILVSIDDAIATVTLNRPDLRNAFNETLIAELTQVFKELDQINDVNVVVLAANGKSFCAGADLNWMKAMAQYSYEENLADAQLLADMLKAIYVCTKPVIAKVQGDAYGGGVGLAAVCDVLVASDKAHFCLSEAKLGLLPATISPYVIQALGVQACRRYFVTAERFSASQAHQLGFVHILTDELNLSNAVNEVCQSILANGPMAVKACKKLVQDFSNQQISNEMISDSVKRIADIRGTPEAQARMKSFLEKR